jgi:ubiquinone/menaquinone biosynthesis C-methylase UbiE
VNGARYTGARVTAVDLSEKSLEIAQQHAQAYSVQDQIQFYRANTEELTKSVPIEPYDLIYSYGVIHHTPHPATALEQLRAYCKPDTTLKLMLYNRNSWKVFWIVTTFGRGKFWKLDELVARHSEAQTGCPVTYSYSKNSVREVLRGFEIEKTEIDFIFPYHIPDYIQHRYVKTWYFSLLPRAALRWLEKQYGWHLLITARPAPVAKNPFS